jgi:hypothetical protein
LLPDLSGSLYLYLLVPISFFPLDTVLHRWASVFFPLLSQFHTKAYGDSRFNGFQGGGISRDFPVCYITFSLYSLLLINSRRLVHTVKTSNTITGSTKRAEAQRLAANRPARLAANQHFIRKLEIAWNLRHSTP